MLTAEEVRWHLEQHRKAAERERELSRELDGEVPEEVLLVGVPSEVNAVGADIES